MSTEWKTTDKSGENDHLLKEDSFFLLLENGFKIIIKEASTAWTKLSKNTDTWTKQSKV